MTANDDKAGAGPGTAEGGRPGFRARAMRFLLRPVLRPHEEHRATVDLRLDQLQHGAAEIHTALAARDEQLEEILQDAARTRDALLARIEQLEETHRAFLGPVERLEEAQQHSTDSQGAALERVGHLEGAATQLAEDMKRELASIREESLDARLAVVTRIEGVEAHLPEMQSDLNTDLRDMRATQGAQGREIDEVGGELVSVTQQLRKFKELVDHSEAQLSQSNQRLRTLEKRFEPLTDLDHFDFAKAYRGDESAIRARLETYAKQFGRVERVLDFGCGRGEFLKACNDLGIGAYGFDSDADMVSHCELQNLEVHHGDGLAHLRGLPSRSLDGIFSAQVVEHLTPVEIVELIQLAAEKLKRGGKIILETINPATWSAMRWFYLDPSHCQPVPAEMLRFFLEDANFEVLDTVYSSPVPEDEKLVLPESDAEFQDPAVAELARSVRRNWERLNHSVFGPQDYAIIAER